LTQIFFHGNEKGKLYLEGTALPLTLAVILAFSIVIGALHSAAITENIAAKKSLSAYYEKLNAHNAGEINEAR
jgi:hypothetical protein